MNPILLASIAIIPLFFLLLGRKRAFSNKIVGLPSPPRLPFIGNLHQLGSFSHHSLHKLSKKNGPLMLLHLGNVPTLVVSSLKIYEEVLKNDVAFSSRPTGKLFNILSYNQLGIGFSPYCENWKQMRRIGMTYLLGSSRVKSLSFERKKDVSLLIEEVADARNGVICLTDALHSYVVNVISRVVLGPWTSEEKKKRFSVLAHETLDLLSHLVLEDVFPKLKWLDVLSGLDGRLKVHWNNWDEVLEETIKEHGGESKEANGNYFIDELLQLHNDSSLGFALTKEHVKVLLMDVITAGVDTSSIVLDWCMAELIHNAGVMLKLKDEIRQIADGANIITEEHLTQMNYLKAFIKEVLRLHPPAPLLVPRESFLDCELLGYKIPKQTRLVVNAWAIGRDESYWESPEQFMPERFLDDKDSKVLSFGFGRRICPGMNFANVMTELAVANLLHRFDWSLPIGVNVKDMVMEDDGLVARRKEKLNLVPIATKVN